MRILLVERSEQASDSVEHLIEGCGHHLVGRLVAGARAEHGMPPSRIDLAVVDLTAGMDIRSLAAAAYLRGRRQAPSLFLMWNSEMIRALRGIAFACLAPPIEQGTLELALAAVREQLAGRSATVVPIGLRMTSGGFRPRLVRTSLPGVGS